VMMRPIGRIVFTCILYKPVVGLRVSAWKDVRSFFMCRNGSATTEARFQRGRQIGG